MIFHFGLQRYELRCTIVLHCFSSISIRYSDFNFRLPSIAKEKISHYIDAKTNNQDPNLAIIYVTQDEEIEAQKLINRTMSELKLIIFDCIENLSPQNQILQLDGIKA